MVFSALPEDKRLYMVKYMEWWIVVLLELSHENFLGQCLKNTSACQALRSKRKKWNSRESGSINKIKHNRTTIMEREWPSLSRSILRAHLQVYNCNTFTWWESTTALSFTTQQESLVRYVCSVYPQWNNIFMYTLYFFRYLWSWWWWRRWWYIFSPPHSH